MSVPDSARPEADRHPAGAASFGDADVTLASLMQMLRRQRLLIVATSLLLVGATVANTLLRPRSYSANVAFLPEGRSTADGVSGIAAQLGLAIRPSGGMQSPTFYIELLGSRPILRDAVTSEYTVQTDTGIVRGDLVTLFGVTEDTPERRVDAAIERLTGSVEVASSGQSGMVRLKVRSRYPELARDVAQRLVELVNAFNLETRRSRAAAEREFVEQRLETVRSDLRASENRLQEFLQQNRVLGSPSLRFEEERLSRDVSLHTQLYTTLAQAYEQAKIDEVRDTPVITIVEPAETPARPDRRFLLRTALVSGLAGLALGLLIGMLRELGAQYRRQVAARRVDSVVRASGEKETDGNAPSSLGHVSGAAR